MILSNVLFLPGYLIWIIWLCSWLKMCRYVCGYTLRIMSQKQILGIFCSYPPSKKLFQIWCQNSSVANLLISNMQATLLQDIGLSLRLAIYSNPGTNYGSDLRFSHSRISLSDIS